MKEHLIAGIDLGSSVIRFAAGQFTAISDKRPVISIVGLVEAQSQGISRGAITSLEDAVSSVSACLEQAERHVGLPISEAFIGIGGTAIQVTRAKGVVGVARPEAEIREDDVRRALESARTGINPANVELLHVLPKQFSVDQQTGIKDPIGMQGIRLEADVCIVQSQAAHVRNIVKCISRTGLELRELVFSPLATAMAVTVAKQRDVGVAVVNVGAATTTIAVYEEGDLLHAAVLPFGADYVTSDIAIGLRTSLEVAEQIKRMVVSAHADEVPRHESLDLKEFGASQSEIVGSRFVADVVQARVEELCERVEKELRSIGRSGMLPAGVVLTGAGAKLRGYDEIAKRILRLPVTVVGAVGVQSSLGAVVNDPAYATAIGLVLWGAESEREPSVINRFGGLLSPAGSGAIVKRVSGSMRKLFRSLLP